MRKSGRQIPYVSFIAGALLITSCQAGAGPTSFTADATAADTTASDGEPSAIIEGRLCPTDNPTTYDNTGGPFLLTWCVGCHSAQLPKGQRAGAPLSIDFDTPAGIEKHLKRIFARSADNNVTMPPTDAISAAERRLMGDWIACGAPGLSEAVMLSIDGAGSTSGTTQPPAQGDCATDDDCKGKCKGAKLGCICVTKGQSKMCRRSCKTDADCPKPQNGSALKCGTGGFCGKS